MAGMTMIKSHHNMYCMLRTVRSTDYNEILTQRINCEVQHCCR